MGSVQHQIALICPVRDPGSCWPAWVDAVLAQTLRPQPVLIMDSSSSDDAATQAIDAGFQVESLHASAFGHGKTRQQAAERVTDVDVVVFLTQDALLAQPKALEKLTACFDDPDVAAAYGRQLPHRDAGHIAAHARAFNYPDMGEVRSLAEVPQLGIKTSFFSNSFGAWRRADLMAVGGFDTHTIVNEDALAASKLILAGKKIAYCADACVYHSHDYTFRAEFGRYFDIGTFHHQQPWIRERFGAAEGEGSRFLRSEFAYLAHNAPWLIPSALLRTCLKYAGFKVGARYSYLPLSLARRLSLQHQFWDRA